MLMVLSGSQLYSQNIFKALIRDSRTAEPLPKATVMINGEITSADQNGFVRIEGLPNGKLPVRFSYIGYFTRTDSIVFPSSTDTIAVLLAPIAQEIDEVVITSTRSTRTIQSIPTRVEFIAGEELEEKGNMKPGDIRMLLAESTGIQTQQTSATSANASIRIQGLDGRYTQILKDGFPLFSGAASGLGLLQTAPLDLKQVEIIKGSASTLYGGGAIAGLVNLISKTPRNERELRFHLNATSAGGLDINGFYGERLSEKLGLTLFASRNSNSAYDPAGIDLTAIPEFERYYFNPKIFLYLGEKTSLNVGLNTTFENRVGGDIHFIEGDADAGHTYFERNRTRRASSQLSFQHVLNERSQVHLKASYGYFDRAITVPDYSFSGVQKSLFSEANYSFTGNRSEWIAGLNVFADNFEEQNSPTLARDYSQNTVGAFVQNTFTVTRWMNIETGLRADHVADYGWALLPRISALFKVSNTLSSRLGGGLGYKAPTIFTEESERIHYEGVLPISPSLNRLEKSYGANLDFNFTPSLSGDVSFSINHLFFYTYLNHPTFLVPLSAETYQLQNINGHIDTRGTETNVKLGFDDFQLFLGYTYTDAQVHEGMSIVQNSLTPAHRINSVLMYEVEDKWKVGAEAYYFGKQNLNTGATGKAYWTTGFMAEKLWETFSLYVNFENFLDTRQTKFSNIYSGSITNPVFTDIYAPLDGFVVNGGLKIRL
ncbi:MAG: hypothetical protein K0S09_376 [Sphingobacteriaceae bacterium]|nr:hypothetical protein [Sphingobacteriaceae bacterium]